ncbi:MAG: NAD(+)/NADH kinase, partial [Planctomycetota bacterium]
DLMVILGGDGAILSAADRMKNNQIMSIGIQIGRFGFLSELTPLDCENKLKQVIEGEGVVKERMMLSCQVIKNKRVTFKGVALNDAVLSASASSRMITAEMEIDGGYVTTFHGDGVIISTPVGSTAHALSAGGPIMEPSLRAFIIAPICSHALTIRPLVVSEKRQIQLRPRGSRNSLTLTLDGQRVHKMDSQETVFIESAPVSFQLLRVVERSYFETLRHKFNWGGTILKDLRAGRWNKMNGNPS